MSTATLQKRFELTQGATCTFSVDAGESTAGSASGILNNGVTVTGGAAAQGAIKPTGAADLTVGSVTVNTGSLWVNGRDCSAGEAVSFVVTSGASQALGTYTLTLSLTLSNSDVKNFVVYGSVVDDDPS